MKSHILFLLSPFHSSQSQKLSSLWGVALCTFLPYAFYTCTSIDSEEKIQFTLSLAHCYQWNSTICTAFQFFCLTTDFRDLSQPGPYSVSSLFPTAVQCSLINRDMQRKPWPSTHSRNTSTEKADNRRRETGCLSDCVCLSEVLINVSEQFTMCNSTSRFVSGGNTGSCI